MTFKKHLIFAKAYDRKGKLLAATTNDYSKSHTIMKKFAVMAGQPERIYLHAEVKALLQSRDKEVYKVTVERYDAKGQPAMAKPCPCCRIALDFYGVQEVEYTTAKGWKKEKLNG